MSQRHYQLIVVPMDDVKWVQHVLCAIDAVPNLPPARLAVQTLLTAIAYKFWGVFPSSWPKWFEQLHSEAANVDPKRTATRMHARCAWTVERVNEPLG